MSQHCFWAFACARRCHAAHNRSIRTSVSSVYDPAVPNTSFSFDAFYQFCGWKRHKLRTVTARPDPILPVPLLSQHEDSIRCAAEPITCCQPDKTQTTRCNVAISGNNVLSCIRAPPLMMMQVGVELKLGKIGPNAMLIAQNTRKAFKGLLLHIHVSVFIRVLAHAVQG